MIDFHVHSNASDGTMPPAALIAEAKKTGLNAVALTDHDTVSGLPEFLEAGRNSGILAVPGVEISSWYYSKELHIVGLFIDPFAEELNAFLENMREERKGRNNAIIRKLQALGYRISEEQVRNIAGGESVGRPHIARALVENGYFTEIQDVFDSLLKRGGRGFIPRQLKPPETACRLIHSAGGIAIWAHPVSGQHSGERSFVRKMLKILIPAGIDGLETMYSTFTPAQSALMEEFAETFGLLRSGGSDFHGCNRNGISLGTGGGSLAVPDSFLEAMESFLQKRNPA